MVSVSPIKPDYYYYYLYRSQNCVCLKLRVNYQDAQCEPSKFGGAESNAAEKNLGEAGIGYILPIKYQICTFYQKNVKFKLYLFVCECNVNNR